MGRTDKIPFYIVDVFAEQKYAGNQLAVVLNGSAFSGDEMQQLAREINFSETAFILGEGRNGFDVRIFTPGAEVPFAGHPTLGTAYIIRRERGDEPEKIVLNLKAGSVPVRFGSDGIAWMRQLEPEFGRQWSAESAASLLGLEPKDVDSRFPVEAVSTGLPHMIIPLRNLSALKRAELNRERYASFVRDSDAKAVLLFSPEPHETQNDVSVRMFAPAYGINEDPATGSGNGCLAGYLVRHRYFRRETIDVRSEQGYEIGRPSLLYLRATEEKGRISIDVGGKCQAIAMGSLL